MTERNPRYDGVYVFKLDISKLLSGDVILTRNAESISAKGKVQSDAIAKITGGTFSHALLCTVPPTLIEAIGDGVSNINAQNCFAHDLKYVRALRYSDQAIARAAGSAALVHLGQRYSLSAAIRSVIPGKAVSAPVADRTFCSALVATAFRAGGAPEFTTIDPMKTTPAILEHATYFSDVTSELFIRILAPNNIEKMSALDGHRIASPMAQQAQIFASYYGTISPLILALIDQYPTLADRKPVSFLECLEFIGAAMRACERLPRGVEADKVRARLMSIDNATFELLAEGKINDMISSAQLVDDQSTQYAISESVKAKPDIDLVDMLGIIASTKKQIASRSSILSDPDAPAGYSRAWDEWISFTQQTVGGLNRRLLALEEVVARVFPSAKVDS
jgi:hypothetical protein